MLLYVLFVAIATLPLTRFESQSTSNSSLRQDLLLTTECEPYIDWNEDKEVFRINCSSTTTCCEYDSGLGDNGDMMVWCDCDKDGEYDKCCQTVLYIFPDDPGKKSHGGANGVCTKVVCTEYGGSVCHYFESQGKATCLFIGNAE